MKAAKGGVAKYSPGLWDKLHTGSFQSEQQETQGGSVGMRPKGLDQKQVIDVSEKQRLQVTHVHFHLFILDIFL